MFLLAGETFAQSRQSLEEQRKKALAEIEETNRFLKETEQSRAKSVEKLHLLDAQIIQFNRLISSINAEISHADRQIGETSSKINRMNAEIDKMKAEYAQLVIHAYKSRGQYNQLIYVLSAKDFNEAYRRMKYFQQYSEFRKKQIDDIKEKQDEMRIVIAQLETQKTEKGQLLAEQRQENKKLETVQAEQNKEVNSLRSQERRLRTQLITQQQKEKRIHDQIAKLIAAETKKMSTSTANPYDKLTPDERLISSNFKGNKGRLPWPTEKGTITGFFGVNSNSLHKYVSQSNNGINITTVGGADVRVVFEGEVAEVAGITGDIFVLVRHGNYYTAYTNLIDVKVKKGDKLKSKDVIGKVYTERGATTAVLNFSIWELGNSVNPMNPVNPELWIVRQ